MKKLLNDLLKSDTDPLIKSDMELINRHSDRVNEHYIWTGMLTKWGQPRFHSKYLQFLRGTEARPYHVKQFLMMLKHDYWLKPRQKLRVTNTCKNVKCINPEHLRIVYTKEYITQETFDKIKEMCNTYPKKFVYSYYGISGRTFRYWLEKSKNGYFMRPRNTDTVGK